MKIHELSIAIIVIAFLTLGLTSYITDIGTNYNQTTDMSTIANLSGRFEPLEEAATGLREDVQALTPEKDAEGSDLFLPYKLIRVGLSMGKTFFRSIVTFGGVTEEIGNALSEMGIPLSNEIITLIITVATFTFVAIILFALWKWRFSDD